MRLIPSIAMLFVLAAGFTACSTTQSQQQSPAAGKISQLISDRNYVFQVQTVLPMSGRTRQMGGEGYDLVVSKDTVSSWLPYFGRAYSAPIDPMQGGIQFASKDFDYTENVNKSGGWDITIKPKDVRDVQQLNLTVSQDGYGTLQVTSTNRQPISFTGIVTEKRSRKKK